MRAATRGYDGGKKVPGRKGHVVTDCLDLLLAVAVTAANVGDRYAARLFDAQEQGATEQRLREIAAEGLRDVYFQDDGRRAGSLERVRFTDIEHVEFGL